MPYNVLYIGSKWCDALPEHGVSNTKHDIVNSLNLTDQAHCQWFAFDAYYAKYKTAGDEALIKLCEENKFDFIILDWMHGLIVPHNGGDMTIEGRKYFRFDSSHDIFHWLNPKHETLDILAHKLNIPIIGKAWDTIMDHYIKTCEELAPYLKFHVISDSSFLLLVVKDPKHYLIMWPPKSPALFYDAGEENRDIPISFIGRYDKTSTNRKESLDYLRKNGINLFYAGGQRFDGTKLTAGEYASLHRRSKITISLPQSVSDLSQVNGRMMEATLSGAMLLEELNLETLNFFIPMVDYIPFYGLSDLYLKAKYFMTYEDQRMEIAQNGYKKATQYYNNKQFWGTIINRLKKENAL